MRDGTVTGSVLDGMRERVTVVEALAHTGGFGAVGTHHGSLELGGHIDDFLEELGIMGNEAVSVVAQPFEEGAARGDEGALGDLGKAVCPVLVEQGLEAADVGAYEDGLVEGADEVLAGL